MSGWPKDRTLPLDGPVIVHDPRRQFGRPTIAGTRVPAEVIGWGVWAEEGDVDGVADDYGLHRDEVLWACAWLVDEGAMVRGKDRARRTLWTQWAEWAHIVLGGWVKKVKLCDPDDFDPAVLEAHYARITEKARLRDQGSTADASPTMRVTP